MCLTTFKLYDTVCADSDLEYFFVVIPIFVLLFMQIGELAGLAVGSTVLLNVMFAGY